MGLADIEDQYERAAAILSGDQEVVKILGHTCQRETYENWSFRMM